MSRADPTTRKYCGSFLRFKKWTIFQGIKDSECFPSKILHVSIYLVCLAQQANSPSSVTEAYNGLKWAHDIDRCSSSTDNRFVMNILEGSKRILSKPVSKKKPITVDVLRKMYLKLFDRNNLYNQRTICMCLLCFAGFLRNKELINIKRSDVSFFSDHIEIFIESSKTDIYRDGTKIVIAKLFSDLCPVRNLELYFSLAGIQKIYRVMCLLPLRNLKEVIKCEIVLNLFLIPEFEKFLLKRSQGLSMILKSMYYTA